MTQPRALVDLDGLDAPSSPVLSPTPPPPSPPVPSFGPDPVARAEVAGLRLRAGVWIAGSLSGIVATILLVGATGATSLGLVGFGACALSALIGVSYAGRSLARGVALHLGAGAALGAVALGFGGLFMAGIGALAALMSTMSFSRGRQIRSFGKILLPPVGDGEGWARSPLAPAGEPSAAARSCTSEETRRELAAQWRENGRTEHASVAAFARLTLDLVALGAPPELIAAANRDALDEIRHAELCFALARSIDGHAASPGAFPQAARARTLSERPALALAQLAVDSLVDGALHEGVSARIIAKLARRADDATIAAILKEIAADEGRHARHGWDVVRWCVSEGGAGVEQALLGAVALLPDRMTSPLPQGARAGGWERWGIMGEALEQEEYAATRADVVRRVRALVDATRASAAARAA